MAKPEWGTKRHCASCGAIFYDFKKDPILCPKCGTEHHPEVLLKPRRQRPDGKAEEAEARKAAVPKPEAIIDDEAEAEDVEGKDFIEDASELGEDDDDVAEEIVGADEEDSEEP